jgi:dipeptidyl aminopeptidase/acylaminoacyl peptidase
MIIKILILITVFTLIFSYAVLYLNTHQPRYHLTTTPAEIGIDFENISFITTDSIKLRGWFIGSQNSLTAPTIIIAHGLGASKSDFINLSGFLSSNGFNVLLFDFRAHGESGGKSCSLGLKEQMDITAALDYIISRKNLKNKNIGLYGFSLGGSAGILTASKDLRIKAIVADTPFSRLYTISADVIKRTYHLPSFPFMQLANVFYRLSFGGWIGQVAPADVIHLISPRPILLITSDIDQMTPIYHALELIRKAGEPKELWVIEGATHGGTISMDTERYNQKLFNFFSKAL